MPCLILTCSLISSLRLRKSFCSWLSRLPASSPASFSPSSASAFNVLTLFWCSYSKCFTFCLYTCKPEKVFHFQQVSTVEISPRFIVLVLAQLWCPYSNFIVCLLSCSADCKTCQQTRSGSVPAVWCSYCRCLILNTLLKVHWGPEVHD